MKNPSQDCQFGENPRLLCTTGKRPHSLCFNCCCCCRGTRHADTHSPEGLLTHTQNNGLKIPAEYWFPPTLPFFSSGRYHYDTSILFLSHRRQNPRRRITQLVYNFSENEKKLDVSALPTSEPLKVICELHPTAKLGN